VPFYRRRWEESRGDEYDAWGPTVYYFWVLDGVVEQQVKLYDSGILLAYDRYHREDQYGGLTTEPMDPDEWAPFEIDITEYPKWDRRAALQSKVSAPASTPLPRWPGRAAGSPADVLYVQRFVMWR
jgi:hypothetical protein